MSFLVSPRFSGTFFVPVRAINGPSYLDDKQQKCIEKIKDKYDQGRLPAGKKRSYLNDGFLKFRKNNHTKLRTSTFQYAVDRLFLSSLYQTVERIWQQDTQGMVNDLLQEFPNHEQSYNLEMQKIQIKEDPKNTHVRTNLDKIIGKMLNEQGIPYYYTDQIFDNPWLEKKSTLTAKHIKASGMNIHTESRRYLDRQIAQNLQHQVNKGKNKPVLESTFSIFPVFEDYVLDEYVHENHPEGLYLLFPSSMKNSCSLTPQAVKLGNHSGQLPSMKIGLGNVLSRNIQKHMVGQPRVSEKTE